MGTQKAAGGSCAIIAYHNQMQVIKKIAKVNRKKIGKKMLLTDIMEFYQTGKYFQNNLGILSMTVRILSL